MSCCFHTTQQKREAVKYELRGHIGLRVQAIQQVEPTLELPDVGEESWNVQLFRSIDSGEMFLWRRRRVGAGTAIALHFATAMTHAWSAQLAAVRCMLP